MSKLLSLYGLKFHPFRPDVPHDALFTTPAVDSFVRRIELGIESRVSPERHTATAQDGRARERQRVLDEVYAPMRAREYARAIARLLWPRFTWAYRSG